MSDRAEEIARRICLAIYSDRKGFTVPPREQIETVEGLIASALRASEERAAGAIGDHNRIEAHSQAILKDCHDWQDRAETAEARVKELEEALREAIDAIEGWAGYASDYFRDKHDLAGDLSRARAALGDKP